MSAGQPSQTMVQAAVLRAAHQLLDEPRIFDDPIAVDLVPEASRDAILRAIDTVLDPASGAPRTPDVGGNARTGDVGRAVAEVLTQV